jgi:outer membrane protein
MGVFPLSGLTQEIGETGENRAWSVRLGGGAAFGPDYRGSNDYKLTPVPLVNVEYSDWLFLGFPYGLGVNLVRGDNLKAGVAFGYGGGRDNEGDLSAIDKVDDGAIGNVFVSYELASVTISGSFSRALSGDNQGDAVELGFDYGGRIANHWVYSLGPSLRWHSEDWNDALFSVSSAESVRLGVRPYRAGGSLSEVALGGSLTRLWGKGWSVTLAVGVSELLGDPADSPIVDDLGSASQISGALLMGYGF